MRSSSLSFWPTPSGITALNAPLEVTTTISFDTGNPATDTTAQLVLSFTDITYDQLTTINVDVGVTAITNDISDPQASGLVPIFKPTYLPADVQPIAILLQCDYGEAGLYLATDLGTSAAYFDPPDVDSMLPIPLIPGGWFLWVDDHLYDIASKWQGSTDPVIHIGEILAVTFLPSRITAYVFSKNRGETPPAT